MTPGIFTPVLEWLASGTWEQAKAGELLEFRFEPPATPPAGIELPFNESEVGLDVLGRECCTLGAIAPFGGSVDFGDVGFHKYRPSRLADSNLLDRSGQDGGKHGYLYTRRGGFIDLGHVRDYIEYTRFFAARYYNAPLSGRTGTLSKVFEEEGEIHLEIASRTEKPSSVLAATMGAKLAYERAIWHEISSYFTSEKFSSFAPEDNFSNAVGVIAGYRALLTPKKPFDVAAEQALLKILAQLGPVHRPEDTDAAIAYVKDHWWSFFGVGNTGPGAKRRNFDVTSPVRPWLVTDIAIAGKEAEGDELRKSLARPKPASIHIPVQHNSQPLDSLAHFEVKNAHASIRNLVPLLDPIRGSDFPTVVAAIRAEGADVDSPGPPVP